MRCAHASGRISGQPVGGRPLVNLSLAFNYALGGTAPFGYHAFNLLVHFLAGLALFGVVRRTLVSPVLRPRFGAASLGLALTAAALWLLHPLQTESVTYLCQRAESLMALCYLSTLYDFIRAVESATPLRWLTAAVLTCWLGMAAKEVMVSAPLIVLLYDRTFVAGAFASASALRRRGRFYAALAATWLLLGVLVAGNLHRGGTAGFATGVTPWSYALTQVFAIPHYLRLALWPHPLVFDYGFESVPSTGALLLSGLVLATLLVFTGLALVRRPALGFAGACFLAILAPASGIVPVATQTMAEHRMYLPLAALTTLAALGLHAIAGRRAFAVGATLALALGFGTARRNTDYRTELALWTDTVAKRPENSCAHNNRGILLFKAGRADEAITSFETALRLRPAYPEAHVNRGAALLHLGHAPEAADEFAAALRLKPDYPEAHNNLGLALKQIGRPAEAIRQFRETLRTHPEHADAHHNLAIALLEAGETTNAITHFAVTLRVRPDFADAHSNLGVALMRAGRFAEALAHYETALRLNPNHAGARDNLTELHTRLEAQTRPPK